jgi:hypothetical protein
MHKLLLISILIADIAIPIWASRHPDGKQALKKTLIGVALFNVFYLGAMLLTWR